MTDEQARYFPAPVVYWLAESKFEPEFRPLAAYSDGALVGFAVYGRDPEDGETGSS